MKRIRPICSLMRMIKNGLAQLAYWFTGGVLKHAKAVTAVTNPLVNSYKRLVRSVPRSGATWAPVYVTYGANNRTQMIRIPAPGRIENRLGDGAANPYLAATVLLAAGLDGIENQIDPAYKTRTTFMKCQKMNYNDAELILYPRHSAKQQTRLNKMK